WVAAGGAMLLFLTNFLSILLAGGGVLALLGLSTVAFNELGSSARRSTFLAVILGIVMVTIPLGITTIEIYQQRFIAQETIQLAEQWIAETGYEFQDVQVSGSQVTLVINGLGERPELSELGDQLNASLDQPIDIKLVTVPTQQENYFAKNE
ncbi:MAG: hypothetical protein GWO38_09210, partial [Phycisphaerae bacterium]|nr:hypothetical protein [Phycisphaerae bacterium]NIX27795.1 hypothetical protein [Phycisphaerae bacterium]